ncbi:MAG: DUF2800 domain-containing protein [Methyloprofundus sp.]|nr:DUF2800 domain-containing protein [Methyloprofundus sp.]
MTTHAKLSASGASRWINCPGSVAAEDGIIEKSSAYADAGSTAHELAEICLVNNNSPENFLGELLPENNSIAVDIEMINAVRDYIDYVKTIPGAREYEQRVDYSEWVAGGFGTSDVISVDNDTIYIVDLKYGKGIRVDADNNSQLMLYALGAYSERELLHDMKNVKMVIMQPRLDHISEWEMSVDDLLKWGAWVAERAEIALSDDAERVPGEKQCQWCKAKARCPALEAYAHKIIGADFEQLDEATQLSDEQIGKALSAKKLIIGWLDAVEDYVFQKLSSGETFEGYKLVEGRSIRQWADIDEVTPALIERLADQAYEQKLISPAKAEKLLGKNKKDIASFIVKPAGKPTLAPSSDKRPAVNLSEDDFEIV